MSALLDCGYKQFAREVAMNTVFVWGAPVVSEERYVRLTKEIIDCFEIRGLGKVVVFFPRDLMNWDLGKEMAVYISGSDLTIGPNRTIDTAGKQALATAIGLKVKLAFIPEYIFCSVLDEPREGEGYWLYPRS